jgi:hypothetical protein
VIFTEACPACASAAGTCELAEGFRTGAATKNLSGQGTKGRDLRSVEFIPSASKNFVKDISVTLSTKLNHYQPSLHVGAFWRSRYNSAVGRKVD